MVIVTDVGKGETTITVQTHRAKQKIIGYDTTILPMPERFYVGVPEGTLGGRTTGLDLQRFSMWLHRVADKMASDIGEILHHAEFIVTTSVTTVEVLGRMHDCDTCREGVRNAVTIMHEHPGTEMIVGQLYWAAGP